MVKNKVIALFSTPLFFVGGFHSLTALFAVRFLSPIRKYFPHTHNGKHMIFLFVRLFHIPVLQLTPCFSSKKCCIFVFNNI